MERGAEAARGGVKADGVPRDVHQRRLQNVLHLQDGRHVMALRLHLFNPSPDDVVVVVAEVGLLSGSDGLTRAALAACLSAMASTRIHRKIGSIRGDDGLGRDAHAAVVHRKLVADQALGPRVSVLDENGLAALPGALAHGLAGLDGLLLEVDGADGRVHGAEEEEEVRAAARLQQTFELLDRQDGVSLGAVVQVVGHLGHVPGQGLAEGDADRLAGRRPSRGHPEQAERGSQHRQRGARRQPPSRAAADHGPGGVARGGQARLARTHVLPLRSTSPAEPAASLRRLLSAGD